MFVSCKLHVSFYESKTKSRLGILAIKLMLVLLLSLQLHVIINIAKSGQSSHTPGSSHQAIPFLLERKKNGHIEGLIYRQYMANSFVQSITCHT